MPIRAFYSDTIADFLTRSDDEIIGRLAIASPFPDNVEQKNAWLQAIEVLRPHLATYSDHGRIYFEFDVPRMGKRIDTLLVIHNAVLVLEFKTGGEKQYAASAIDQVLDYALDLKNFHETSHGATIAPILVVPEAAPAGSRPAFASRNDGVLCPLLANRATLGNTLAAVLGVAKGPLIDGAAWESGRYSPTPTIVEAARALYGGHSVKDISRSDAGAVNLTQTSDAISRAIQAAQAGGHKVICFVTGVPGSGKTLVGLNTATKHSEWRRDEDPKHSVFLSGNDPLVKVLQEALARDRVSQGASSGRKESKKNAHSQVRAFIQNIRHFRDEYVKDTRPPSDHVVLFDEAQRAWDRDQLEAFMRRKRGRPGFTLSEPEFLISCMDRHKDWAVVVCLVGGGQEINVGEAGIGEWIESILRGFADWHVRLSPNLNDSEYGAGAVLARLEGRPNVRFDSCLHLSVSMRSFRAEKVSAFVKAVLDTEVDAARTLLAEVAQSYPIMLTREMEAAKSWLREKALGSERCGLVVSSKAQRLKPVPVGINVRAKADPVHYFLAPKDDVRSSYYLEDAATEFEVQGLELDWAGVVWDGDFRRTKQGWGHFAFRGSRWERVKQAEWQAYLKNAYRVLLTRARQGMVIVVPEGESSDPTRDASFYDGTYDYLREVGLDTLT